MRRPKIVDQLVLGPLGLLVACLCVLSAPVPDAWAGDWSFEAIGPGANPSHVRVRVAFTTQPTINCFAPCDYVLGYFDGRISPAPPEQEIFGPGCLEALSIDESGADFSTPCAAAPGVSGGYFEIDLDPAFSYVIDGAYAGTWLEGGCQGGLCCPNDFCYGDDSNFAQLGIPANPVPVQAVMFSRLKARF